MPRSWVSKTVILFLAAATTVVLIWVYISYGLKFLAPGLVVLSVFALMLFFRDLKAPFFYLLVFLLPVFIARYLVPIPEAEHPGVLNVPVLYAYEIPLYLFIGFWGLEFLSGKATAIRLPRTTGAMAFLFVPAVISMTVAMDYTYGIFELLRMFEMFLFFLVVVNYLRSDRQLKTVFILLGVTVALQSILGLIQFLSPYKTYDILASFGIYMGISHARPYDPSSPLRACGTTGYCNALAGYFELVVPLFVSLYFFYPMEKKLRRWVLVLLALATAALLVTYSRGGFLGMILAVVALLVFAARRFPQLSKHAAKIVAAVAVQLVVLLAIFSGKLMMRMQFFMEQSMEDDVRVALIRDAFEMIKHHPLFGVGLNNFPEAFALYEITGMKFDINYPVHNTWLLITAEQGLFGLVAFLILMWVVFRSAFRGMRERSPFHSAAAIGLTAGLIGWFGHNLVAPLYQNWLVNRMTFVLVIALVAVIPRLLPDDRDAPAP
jgi:putative inorganic carbon (HCO3(-)) transporter